MSEVGDLIKKLADDGQEIYCITGKVISVDILKRTCEIEPSNGKANLQEVRLQATPESDKGFVMIPKVDKYVLVGFITKDEATVLLAEELEKVLCDVDLFEFNGGTLGGMVKLLDLVSRLNILESDLNTIKTVFKTWTPVAQDGGAALKAGATAWSINTLTSTNRTDLENTKIKQ